MKTTILFNIRINSNKSELAVSQLTNAGLKPFFTKSPNQKTEQLAVTVDSGTYLHDVAKSFLFDSSFNCN